MFTVVEFFEDQQLRVLAVPLPWVRDGFLMWPKLGNEAANVLRKSGTAYYGATKKYPAISHRKFKHLSAAEAVVEEMLHRDISDVEAKRQLLKRRNPPTNNSVDYNNRLEEITGTSSKLSKNISSTMPSHEKSNTQKRTMQWNNTDVVDVKNEISNLNSSIINMKKDILDAVQVENSIKFEAAFATFKKDLLTSVKTTIEEAVQNYFEANIPRLASILNVNSSKVAEPPQQQNSNVAETHDLINDEQDVANFNLLLSRKEIFTDYINYFKKIIPTDTYAETGDSACYVVTDCLFKRKFWTLLTYTGINKGSKSTKGFREYGNVLQLMLEVVRNGDPSYTNKKLENFLKKKIFRYSKQRALSYQLRKSTCRPNRSSGIKKIATLNETEITEENEDSTSGFLMEYDEVSDNEITKLDYMEDTESNDESC